MSAAAKPQLRGLLASQIKKNLIGMSIVSIGAALTYKVLVCDRRKQRYADFYKQVSFVLQIFVLFILILLQHQVVFICCIDIEFT